MVFKIILFIHALLTKVATALEGLSGALALSDKGAINIFIIHTQLEYLLHDNSVTLTGSLGCLPPKPHCKIESSYLHLECTKDPTN